MWVQARLDVRFQGCALASCLRSLWCCLKIDAINLCMKVRYGGDTGVCQWGRVACKGAAFVGITVSNRRSMSGMLTGFQGLVQGLVPLWDLVWIQGCVCACV